MHDQQSCPLIIDDFTAFNLACCAFADVDAHALSVLNSTALDEWIAAIADDYVLRLILGNTGLHHQTERIFRKNEASAGMIMNIAFLDSWCGHRSTNAQANSATHDLTLI